MSWLGQFSVELKCPLVLGFPLPPPLLLVCAYVIDLAIDTRLVLQHYGGVLVCWLVCVCVLVPCKLIPGRGSDTVGHVSMKYRPNVCVCGVCACAAVIMIMRPHTFIVDCISTILHGLDGLTHASSHHHRRRLKFLETWHFSTVVVYRMCQARLCPSAATRRTTHRHYFHYWI